jgi:putative lipoprotein
VSRGTTPPQADLVLPAILGALFATACSSPVALPQIAARIVERVPAPAPARVVTTRYDCGGRTLMLAVFPTHATLVEESEIILQRTPSPSGRLYANGDVAFLLRSPDATLDWYGEAIACQQLPDPWKNAGSSGIDFRAVGQEPGWFVEIDDERLIHLVYDYAERELTTRAPSKTIESDRTIYTGQAGNQVVTVAIQEKRCADVMSGEPYPFTVTVTVDDRVLEGCGRLVTQGSGGKGGPTDP